jgi:hypothetical protein
VADLCQKASGSKGASYDHSIGVSPAVSRPAHPPGHRAGGAGFAAHLGAASSQAADPRNTFYNAGHEDVYRKTKRKKVLTSGFALENSAEPAQGLHAALKVESRCGILLPVGA